MKRDEPLTLKGIIDALTEIYKQHGDLQVEINTQDGDWYELWPDYIAVNKFDNGEKFLEIG
jgi:hypothetical protein